MPSTFHYPDTTAFHTRLPNGLDIIIKEDHHADVVSLQVWCGAGSIHEDEWLGAGLSHILEHMLFKGTRKRQGPEIATEVQDAGGYINAYTSFDRTVYWIDAPGPGSETCLDILLDVVTQATIPEEEYEKEREVIRREFAMGFDDPDRMSSHLLFATAYHEHPYQHPVIGHLDIFNRLKREDVMAYYRKHYIPNNLLIVIVGAVDPERVRAQIADHFRDIPAQPYAPPNIPNEPPQLGKRDVHEEFETQLTKMHLAWHIPSIAHPDMPALDVLAGILGQGKSSRIYQSVREKKRLAHSIGAYAYTPAHGGIFGVSATADPGKRQAVESAVGELIQEIQEHGVSPEEVEKAKKIFLVDMLDELTTMRGQANDLATNWMLARNLNFTRDYLASVHEVESDTLRSIARRYLTASNLTSVSLNPKGSLPRIPGFRSQSRESPTRRFQLANGLTVLLQEDARVPLVAVRISFLAGPLLENEKTSGLTRLTARGMLKGTIHRTASELVEAMENTGGSIGANAGNNTFTLSTSGLQEDLPLALELLSDVLLHPTFPESEIEHEKTVQIADIRSESDHLVSLAARHLRKTLFGDHPYAHVRSGTEASVASLGRDHARTLHEETVRGANGVVAIYGAISTDATLDLVRQFLEPLPGGERPVQDIPTPPSLKASQTLDLGTDKQQAVLVVGYPGVAIDSPDRLALELVEEACSDMSSRLFMKIREEMGLAYYVSASQMIGLAPGVFYFYLGTDPGKLDDVQGALQGEIVRLAADGLDAAELKRAKKTLLGKIEMERQSIGSRAMIEGLDELYGFGYDHHRGLAKRVEATTAQDIQQALQRHFHEKPSVTVRISPALSKARS